MDNAIEINGLRKEYKGFALDDVTFDVPRGYIMGLIGPNGLSPFGRSAALNAP